jgi:hypothetical protein
MIEFFQQGSPEKKMREDIRGYTSSELPAGISSGLQYLYPVS